MPHNYDVMDRNVLYCVSPFFSIIDLHNCLNKTSTNTTVHHVVVHLELDPFMSLNLTGLQKLFILDFMSFKGKERLYHMDFNVTIISVKTQRIAESEKVK